MVWLRNLFDGTRRQTLNALTMGTPKMARPTIFT
jgi:hypothetical protein